MQVPVQRLASGIHPDSASATRQQTFTRTVMIGSSGPKISSVMMSESSGGFSSSVGSMLLHNWGNIASGIGAGFLWWHCTAMAISYSALGLQCPPCTTEAATLRSARRLLSLLKCFSFRMRAMYSGLVKNLFRVDLSSSIFRKNRRHIKSENVYAPIIGWCTD